MSRHLGSLTRLHWKLQSAFGDDHALVVQLKREVVCLQALESKHLDHAVARSGRLPGRLRMHRWDPAGR
jgi:hypothetical protein